MRTILVLVSSLNGKITKGEDSNVTRWSSMEDQVLFGEIRKKSKVIVMGRKTYEAARPLMNFTPETLRIVLTRNPHTYRSQAMPGMLEFTSEIPKDVVKRLEAKFKEIFLFGGADLASQFLQEGLVSEIWITIEPLLFGSGISFVTDIHRDISLRLISVQRLNERGTLHLRYKVV